MMIEGRDIVCFANDWNTDPTSKHHLMRRFSEANRVLWIEAAGMRRPQLTSASDITRMSRKVRSFLQPARQALPGLHVYSPPSVPLPGSRRAARVNASLYRWSIGRELQRLGMSAAPLLWIYGPHVAPSIRAMPRSGVVYHCVDRWSAFSSYDPEFMESCEADVCRTADVVFASAQDLADRCRVHARNVHYMPHGVDHAHFRQALKEEDLPPDLPRTGRPIVGFFGLIHDWVDIDLIARLADALPYEFVLIGASNQDVTALAARSNVHVLGRKPYAELPRYARGFAAAIVPFRTTALTHSVNPIKLREYAAAGLPVVSTGLPEVVKCGSIVRIADSFESWQRQLRAAVADGCDRAWRRAQSDRVAPDDWSFVAGRMSEIIAPSLTRASA